MRYVAETFVRRNSADAEFRIIDTHSGATIAVVDPDSDHTDGAELTKEIAAAMNAMLVLGG